MNTKTPLPAFVTIDAKLVDRIKRMLRPEDRLLGECESGQVASFVRAAIHERVK